MRTLDEHKAALREVYPLVPDEHIENMAEHQHEADQQLAAELARPEVQAREASRKRRREQERAEALAAWQEYRAARGREIEEAVMEEAWAQAKAARKALRRRLLLAIGALLLVLMML